MVTVAANPTMTSLPGVASMVESEKMTNVISQIGSGWPAMTGWVLASTTSPRAQANSTSDAAVVILFTTIEAIDSISLERFRPGPSAAVP